MKMAHNLLLQADDLLKQMGLEARGVDDATMKRDLLAKVSLLILLWHESIKFNCTYLCG